MGLRGLRELAFSFFNVISYSNHIAAQGKLGHTGFQFALLKYRIYFGIGYIAKKGEPLEVVVTTHSLTYYHQMVCGIFAAKAWMSAFQSADSRLLLNNRVMVFCFIQNYDWTSWKISNQFFGKPLHKMMYINFIMVITCSYLSLKKQTNSRDVATS